MNHLPWATLGSHVSWFPENGWRATELWQYGGEAYEARDAAAEKMAKEFNAEVRIYPAEFVYLPRKR